MHSILCNQSGSMESTSNAQHVDLKSRVSSSLCGLRFLHLYVPDYRPWSSSAVWKSIFTHISIHILKASPCYASWPVLYSILFVFFVNISSKSNTTPTTYHYDFPIPRPVLLLFVFTLGTLRYGSLRTYNPFVRVTSFFCQQCVVNHLRIWHQFCRLFDAGFFSPPYQHFTVAVVRVIKLVNMSKSNIYSRAHARTRALLICFVIETLSTDRSANIKHRHAHTHTQNERTFVNCARAYWQYIPYSRRRYGRNIQKARL